MRGLMVAMMFALGCNGQTSEPLKRAQAVEAAQDATSAASDVRYAELLARPVPELGTQSTMTDDDMRKFLTDEEFHILRQRGTERAFSGEYHASKSKGVYHCRACNAPLFESETKFDSRTGWPSFYAGIEGRVSTLPDNSYGMTRTEIVCAHCGSHLGHVFDDGPEPTGQRYCANSLSLILKETP